MANKYPGAIPSFPTITDGSSAVRAQDNNLTAREVEGARSVLGDYPQGISAPYYNPALNPTPMTVGKYLNYLASIVTTMTGAVDWASAAVPLRQTLFGSGGGSTVAGSSTSYLGFFQQGLNATEANQRIVVPYACTLWNLSVQTLTSQPAGGSLVFTFMKNGSSTGYAFTYPAGGGASIQYAQIVGGYAVAAGATLDVKIVNSSGSTSAQIGAVSIELDQAG